MVATSYIPNRGDIIWLDFNPQLGHEQSGVRPALVLSPKAYNLKSQLMLACPITSKIKGYPFEVRIKSGKIDGVIIADQIKSLDWRARKPKLAGIAPDEVIGQTLARIEMLLKS